MAMKNVTRLRQAEKEAAIELMCQEHISLLKPQPGPKGFRELDESWLEQELEWTWPVKSRIHRYLHFNDLYEFSDTENNKLKKLCDLFVQSSNISDTPVSKDIVSERCSSLIYSSAHQWRMEGLLSLDQNDQLVKSPIFKRIWDNAVESAVFVKSSRKTSKKRRRQPRYVDSAPSPDDSSQQVSKKHSSGLELSQLATSKRARPTESPVKDDSVGDCIVVDVGPLLAKPRSSKQHARIHIPVADVDDSSLPSGPGYLAAISESYNPNKTVQLMQNEFTPPESPVCSMEGEGLPQVSSYTHELKSVLEPFDTASKSCHIDNTNTSDDCDRICSSHTTGRRSMIRKDTGGEELSIEVPQHRSPTPDSDNTGTYLPALRNATTTEILPPIARKFGVVQVGIPGRASERSTQSPAVANDTEEQRLTPYPSDVESTDTLHQSLQVDQVNKKVDMDSRSTESGDVVACQWIFWPDVTSQGAKISETYVQPFKPIKPRRWKKRRSIIRFELAVKDSTHSALCRQIPWHCECEPSSSSSNETSHDISPAHAEFRNVVGQDKHAELYSLSEQNRYKTSTFDVNVDNTINQDVHRQEGGNFYEGRP